MNKPVNIRSRKLRQLLGLEPSNPPRSIQKVYPGESLTLVLHEDEWAAFLCMDVPESHYTKSFTEDDWIQIVIDADWVEKFLIMARLWSWDNVTRHYEFVYPVAD